jgi:hypothetical protein
MPHATHIREKAHVRKTAIAAVASNAPIVLVYLKISNCPEIFVAHAQNQMIVEERRIYVSSPNRAIAAPKPAIVRDVAPMVIAVPRLALPKKCVCLIVDYVPMCAVPMMQHVAPESNAVAVSANLNP